MAISVWCARMNLITQVRYVLCNGLSFNGQSVLTGIGRAGFETRLSHLHFSVPVCLNRGVTSYSTFFSHVGTDFRTKSHI